MTHPLNTDNLRIQATSQVIPPREIIDQIPITDRAAKIILQTRDAIGQILSGKDDRLLVIVGPCSIHDTQAALAYAELLKKTKDQFADDLVIVMRVYFEKPRTRVGWKGLINDPGIDGSFNINKGLRVARQLLLDLNNMGVTAGVEYLDLITPQYISDLVSWGAIGARTTESQVHRELASGLSCPVGFKNGTDGNTDIAIDAINCAMNKHHFLSVTKAGHSAIFSTSGNEFAHIILRGGYEPNYDAVSVDKAAEGLLAADLPANIMIDFSHANSLRQHQRQLVVAESVGQQIAQGDQRIIGAMIESHLLAGRQNITAGEPLVYGQSITDACLGWEDSELLLQQLAAAVQNRRRAEPISENE